MLIQFRFKNFKSFRDDTILDLSATKITEPVYFLDEPTAELDEKSRGACFHCCPYLIML